MISDSSMEAAWTVSQLGVRWISKHTLISPGLTKPYTIRRFNAVAVRQPVFEAASILGYIVHIDHISVKTHRLGLSAYITAKYYFMQRFLFLSNHAVNTCA